MRLQHTAPDNSDERISHALQLLIANPQLKLREIAKIFEMSPSRLRYLFKRDIGMSIGQFIRELRFERARGLLQQTYRSQKEIRRVRVEVTTKSCDPHPALRGTLSHKGECSVEMNPNLHFARSQSSSIRFNISSTVSRPGEN